MKELPLIEVSGPAANRGRAYGEAGRDRIRLGVQHYTEQLRNDGLDAGALEAVCLEFLPKIAAFDDAYVDEMKGISEGANVSLADIVLLNARTEILQIAQRDRPSLSLVPEADPDGCTGVIVLPSASEDGNLIHAQNWDWKAECADTAIVLRIKGEAGAPDILTFAEAGQLARCGLNSAGIAITANYLESDRDYKKPGVPLALLRRKVLQQSLLAPGLQAVYCTPKSASNNIMVSQAEGFGIDIECAPDESFLIHPQKDVLVHANHWQSDVALSKIRDTGVKSTPDSLYRDLRTRALIEPHHGAITTDTVKHALFDDWQSPFSVCRPSRPGSSGNLSATVAMVVMTPVKGEMEVSLLPAENRKFSTFSIN